MSSGKEYTSANLPRIEDRAPEFPQAATLLTCPWEVLILISDMPYNAMGDRKAVFRWYSSFVKASKAYGTALVKLVAPKDHPMFHGFRHYLEPDPDVLKPTPFGFVHAEATFVMSLRPHPQIEKENHR
jgi:hypothetical protein